MRHWGLRGSVPAKLALIALAMLLALAIVRVITLNQISKIREVSAEVRNHWLDAIRIVGDLRQRTASIRTEEVEILVTVPPLERTFDLLRRNLDAVASGIAAYRRFTLDGEETAALDTFLGSWNAHASQTREIMTAVRAGRSAEALGLIQGSAQDSWFRTRDALDLLAEITTRKAEDARKLSTEATENAERWVSGTLAAALILFTALTAYLWFALSRPLLRLAGGMQRLTSQETGSVIPYQGRTDEIGEMARAVAVFQANTVELLDTRRTLSAQAEALTRSLARERALAAEERNFVRTMSHEFRTPLTRIDGQAQRLIARKNAVAATEIGDRAIRIRAAVAIMADLVTSLTTTIDKTLDTAPVVQAVDLAAVLGEVVAHHRAMGDGEAIDVRVSALPPVMGDPALLQIAFGNLLSNALKYSPMGGSVTVSGFAGEGAATVTVEDRGVGIAAEDLLRVRERFFRGGNVGAVPGTGIGLHLVDQIVGHHGGDLMIQSTTGEGTRVTVVLPASTGEAVKESG